MESAPDEKNTGLAPVSYYNILSSIFGVMEAWRREDKQENLFGKLNHNGRSNL